VVCPDADLKVYLDASATERARRRLRQSNGPLEELDAVRAAIKERDRLDSSRALAPLARAEDAVLVATDSLSIDQVVERILELAAKRCLPGARSS
jgi:cytidylate kinase